MSSTISSRPAGCEIASTPSTGRRRLWSPPRKSETPHEAAEARLIARASNPRKFDAPYWPSRPLTAEALAVLREGRGVDERPPDGRPRDDAGRGQPRSAVDGDQGDDPPLRGSRVRGGSP